VDVSDVVVNDIMKGHLRSFSGDLYGDPRVTAVVDEGRGYAERTRERFDLIDFSIVGGMNLEKMDLMRIDDLFTLEALRTYLARLSPDGIFSYVMYSTRADRLATLAAPGARISQPYIPALRTLAGLRIAMGAERPGLRFSDRVLIAALRGVIDPSYDLVHIIVGKSPFSAAESRRFEELCRTLGFERIYPPPVGGPRSTDVYASVVESGDLAGLSGSLPFSIWPATDDRPFQYGLDRAHLAKAFAGGELWGLLAGNPLIALGTSVGLVAVLVTLVPLVVSRAQGGAGPFDLHGAGLLVYFALIGFGYMAVEIAALLRLQSYLGKPIYGLSIGLFAFLLASGVGSHLTGSWDASRLGRSAARAAGLVVAAGFGFLWLSGPLFAGTVAWPLPARASVAVIAVFPLALPMGMLFPTGVRLVARRSEDLIPWAWATNGCMSVLGIFATRILAVFLGFSRALVLGLVAYALVAAFTLAYQAAKIRKSVPRPA
jgi:hypothetical protein